MTAEQAAQKSLRLIAQAKLPERPGARPGYERQRRRQLAAYLTVVAAGVPAAGAARVIGVRHSTVQHALRVIEEARDDQRFDAAVSRLERAFLGRRQA